MHSPSIPLVIRPRPHPFTILRWLARAASLASLGTLSMFAFGERGVPTRAEWLLLAFFPIGMAVGMVVGWWRELFGGLITLGSLAVFYGIMFASRGQFPPGPYFAVLGSPGAIFLAAALVGRSTRSQ